MSSTTKKSIIDFKCGNITDENCIDKVILVGSYPYEGTPYTENMELILNPNSSKPISIKVPYDGYNMQLFVGDFTGDNKSEIMVRGSFGGSGGFEVAVIYKYENNQLVEIFNQDTFNKSTNCYAKFKDNYKVHVTCGDKKYSIDISSRPKDYLDMIYSPDGKLKYDYTISIDSPNGFFPIKQVYNDYYELLIQQRIVGIVNADTLSIIQTLGSLLDSKFEVVYKGLLLLSPDSNNRKISRKHKPNSNINKKYHI